MSNEANEKLGYAAMGALCMIILYLWWEYVLALVIAWCAFTLWAQHGKHR